MELKGVITALVTPFSNGRIDYSKLKNLVKYQLEGGVDGILPMGTTGESPTLSVDEHLKVIETVVEEVNGQALVIAGTGANSTAEAIELTINAKKAGVDASLQVTPYYNKPTQDGLYRHFSIIADESDLPIILYNVPGRSAVPIEIDTVVKLCSNSNIIGIKEAAGSVDRVSAILNRCNTTVLSGDDALTLPMMSVGATGVVSVASNIIPSEIKALVDATAKGDYSQALQIHKKYYQFFSDLFIETNPIPIKAAMAQKGLLVEEYRLPMSPMSSDNREVLIACMKQVGIL